LSVAQLEALGEALLDFSSRNDLVVWLESHWEHRLLSDKKGLTSPPGAATDAKTVVVADEGAPVVELPIDWGKSNYRADKKRMELDQ
jgi:hypothetical protein